MSLAATFVPTLALAFSLSADAFAVAASKGTQYGKLPWAMRLQLALWMGGLAALAPVAGWLIGQTFADHLVAYDHWVAFVLLSGLGLHMIAVADDAEARGKTPPLTMMLMFTIALATSADAAVAGLSLNFMHLPLVQTVIAIGLVSFGATLLGLKAGKLGGKQLGAWAEVVGGFGLIAIGTHIIVRHVMG